MLAFIQNLGWPELLIILIIALLIFGARLPEVMRNMGKSVNEFKRGMNEVGDELTREPPPPTSPPPTATASAPPPAATPADDPAKKA